MTDKLIRIESGLGNGLLLGIDTASPGRGYNPRCVTALIDDPNGTTWAIHEMARTNMFYLVHAATSLVCVFASDGIVLLAQQNAYAAGENLWQLITTDDTGEGLVAINNYNKSQVFTVAGAARGDFVNPYEWNGGNNQRWRLNTLD